MPPAAQTTLRAHPALLIASIGNPAPYFNTLHSAGHHLLARLAILLCAPPLSTGSQLARGNCSHTNHSSDPSVPWMLWQSPVQMNVSGKAVKKAWTAWIECKSGAGMDATQGVRRRMEKKKRLVVLHDEMESPLGKVKFRGGLADDEYDGDDDAGAGKGRKGNNKKSNDGGGGSTVASAKGHNGVKSILDAFCAREKSKQQHRFDWPDEISRSSIIRVGVGIGRPVSRDASDVSRYVLKTMSERERRLVEGAAEQVLGRLQALKVHTPSEMKAEQ